MSGKELDNLFKNKLEELETTPSPQAWDKLQSGLAGQQKKIKYPYWRVAAAILLLISFVWLFWWSGEEMAGDIVANADTEDTLPIRDSNEENTATLNDTVEDRSGEKGNGFALENSIAHNNEKLEVEEIAKTQETQTSTKSNNDKTEASKGSEGIVEIGTKSQGIEETQNQTKVSADLNETKNGHIALTENVTANGVEENTTESVIIASDNTVNQVIAENNSTDATLPSNEASTVQDAAEEKSTVLVFDIEEFDKKTAVAQLDEGAQKEVKQSKFRKILNFVKNVKEGDGGMAGIREAKDDLFTFDSKKNEDDSE